MIRRNHRVKWLGYPDSNQERQDQNLQCCQLHHTPNRYHRDALSKTMQNYTLPLERPNKSAFFSREKSFCRAHAFFSPRGAHPYSARAVRNAPFPATRPPLSVERAVCNFYFMHTTPRTKGKTVRTTYSNTSSLVIHSF